MPDTDRMDDGASAPSVHVAPLWRRLAAMLYDTLIVIALLMLATAIVLPFNDGEAFASGNIGLQLYLMGVVTGFFLLFWRLGGQTLGMRAWKIKLVAKDHGKPGYVQLIVRAFTGALGIALCGLGVLWSIVDREKLAVHDRLSDTRLILHSKQ